MSKNCTGWWEANRMGVGLLKPRVQHAEGIRLANRAVVEGYEVAMPSPEEQTAIAAVLSDMDVEIMVLEARGSRRGGSSRA